MYKCEFEFVREGDHVLCWPFWPGRVDGTQGEDIDDAVEMAADWLREMVLECLVHGYAPPRPPMGNAPQRGGTIVMVAVETPTYVIVE